VRTQRKGDCGCTRRGVIIVPRPQVARARATRGPGRSSAPRTPRPRPARPRLPVAPPERCQQKPEGGGRGPLVAPAQGPPGVGAGGGGVRVRSDRSPPSRPPFPPPSPPPALPHAWHVPGHLRDPPGYPPLEGRAAGTRQAATRSEVRARAGSFRRPGTVTALGEGRRGGQPGDTRERRRRGAGESLPPLPLRLQAPHSGAAPPTRRRFGAGLRRGARCGPGPPHFAPTRSPSSGIAGLFPRPGLLARGAHTPRLTLSPVLAPGGAPQFGGG